MNAIIIENNPNASVNEKPNIANVIKLFLIDGFLDTPFINDPNIIPTSYPCSY